MIERSIYEECPGANKSTFLTLAPLVQATTLPRPRNVSLLIVLDLVYVHVFDRI